MGVAIVIWYIYRDAFFGSSSRGDVWSDIYFEKEWFLNNLLYFDIGNKKLVYYM